MPRRRSRFMRRKVARVRKGWPQSSSSAVLRVVQQVLLIDAEFQFRPFREIITHPGLDLLAVPRFEKEFVFAPEVGGEANGGRNSTIGDADMFGTKAADLTGV